MGVFFYSRIFLKKYRRKDGGILSFALISAVPRDVYAGPEHAPAVPINRRESAGIPISTSNLSDSSGGREAYI